MFCIDKVFDEHRLVEDQQFTKKDDGRLQGQT